MSKVDKFARIVYDFVFGYGIANLGIALGGWEFSITNDLYEFILCNLAIVVYAALITALIHKAFKPKDKEKEDD